MGWTRLSFEQQRATRLLYGDSAAGGLAGGLMLCLSDWLSRLEQIPETLLRWMGAMNMLYGMVALGLATWLYRRQRLPPWLKPFWIGANLVWAMVCLGLLAVVGPSASLWGMAHLLGEAGFVAGLAWLESLWITQECLAH